jgi:hypothetical protein
MKNGNDRKLKNPDDTKNKKQLSGMRATLTKMEDTVAHDIDPCLSLSLRVVGHSFNPGSQPFIPMVKLLPSNKINFPPCG